MTHAPQIYRAPMWSRDDQIDRESAVAWALRHGVVAVGGHVPIATECLDEAIEMLRERDERLGRRLARFAAVEPGSFMWTRTSDGARLGRLVGSWVHDVSPDATRHDLPHTRACDWVDRPIAPGEVPAAVQHTFARGGRNFQRIHSAPGEVHTARLWSALAGR